MTPDFRVENHGSVFLVAPQNPFATDHLRENTGSDAQWWAGALAVEHSYIADLVTALRENGFAVE